MTDAPDTASLGEAASDPAALEAAGGRVDYRSSAERVRPPPPKIADAVIGGLLGAATGALLWVLYARVGQQHATIAALAVGLAAGLGVRLKDPSWGRTSGLIAISTAAVGIAIGELLCRFVIPGILSQETGLPLAIVEERLGVLSLNPMDAVFYGFGLWFAYRVASLPRFRR